MPSFLGGGALGGMDPELRVRRKSRLNLKVNPMQAAMEAKRKKAEEEEAKRIAGSGGFVL